MYKYLWSVVIVLVFFIASPVRADELSDGDKTKRKVNVLHLVLYNKSTDKPVRLDIKKCGEQLYGVADWAALTYEKSNDEKIRICYEALYGTALITRNGVRKKCYVHAIEYAIKNNSAMPTQ